MKSITVKVFIVIVMTIGVLNYAMKYSVEFLRSYRAPTMVESFVAHKMTLTKTLKENYDVIFIGDSACLGGVEAIYVADQLGMSVFNFSCVGWVGPVGYRIVLESYLKYHPVPKIVVLSIYPRMAQQKESRNPEFLRRFRRHYDPQYISSGFSHLLDSKDSFKEKLRSFIGRMRSITREELLAQKRDPWPSHNSVYQTLVDQGGFYPDTRGLPIKPEPFRHLDPTDWFDGAMRHLIDFARQKKIKLLISFSPMADVNEGIRSTKLEQWAKQIDDAYGHVTVRLPVLHLWPTNHFSKYSHLNLIGARRYSDEMVDLLQRYMDK